MVLLQTWYVLVILLVNEEATVQEARQLKERNTPVGRSGTGEDIARTIAFLCEDDSDMITGTIIEVTGAVDVIHRHR